MALVDSTWIPGGVAFRCVYGYVPIGSSLATFNSDVWSEVLECEEAVDMLVADMKKLDTLIV